jgi:hypothetical protein
MLRRDPLAERRQLLPGGRHLVAELVHQGLVVVGDALGDVVRQADEPAVRTDTLGEDELLEPVEQLLRDVGLQVQCPVVPLGGGHGDEVGAVERDVRPARADLVGQGDLRRDLEDVHDLDGHEVRPIGVGGLPRLDRGHADTIDPDHDGRVRVGCQAGCCDEQDRRHGGQQMPHE